MLTLFPDQQDDFAALRAAFREHRRVLFQASTGYGKTVMACTIAAGAMGRGTRTAFTVHRKELIRQTCRAFDEAGIPYGVIAPDWKPNPAAQIQIASTPTLARRSGHEFDFVIEDECLPAGTLIDGKPIELIRTGDTVLSFNENTETIEPRKVVAYMNRFPSDIYTFNLSNGTTISCTPNHPFFCKSGWVDAKQLTIGSYVYVKNENMQYLRAGISEPSSGKDLFASVQSDIDEGKGRRVESKLLDVREGSADLHQKGEGYASQGPGVLFGGMQGRNESRHFVRNDGEDKQEIRIGADEAKQPDGPRGHQKENVRHAQEDWTQAEGSLREREPYEATNAPGECFGMEDGSRRDGVETSVQDRHCTCWHENRDRSGRREPLLPEGQGDGRQKRNGLMLARVDHIEVQEQGCDGRFGGVCEDGLVYNIEVEGNNNYFANGVLVHNCHHVPAGQWQAVRERFTDAAYLGLTATPVRLDGQGLGPYYDTIHCAHPMRWLIEHGRLSRYEYWAPEAADLSGLRKPREGHDYTAEALERLMVSRAITGNVIGHYRRICDGAPFLCRCVSVAHAQQVADEFRAAGYPVEALWGAMPSTERDRVVAGLGRDILGIAFCDLISEGFDVPAVVAFIDLRKTQSLGLYLQGVGRALRIAPGKDHAVILDCVGNFAVHGMPDADRHWTLESGVTMTREKANDEGPDIRRCERCYAVHEWAAACPYCGFVYPSAPAREIKTQAGELKKIGPYELARLEAAKAPKTEEELQDLKKRAYESKRLEDFHAYCRHAGLSSGAAWMMFKRARGGAKRRTAV